MNLSAKGIQGERLRRQGLVDPLDDAAGYRELFKLLQPVSPIYYSRPGDPPRLAHRTTFDDGFVADRMRAKREMVKGRFLGGGIGYVLSGDLELYANTFRLALPKPSEMQKVVLDSVEHTGPLTPRQIKEDTGLLNKQIMPALHRLQKAFLVYEDQLDRDWERGWYAFASEWPEIELAEHKWAYAATQVVLRFLRGHVFATYEQLRDWSGFASKPLQVLLSEMESSKLIVLQGVRDLGEGWVLAEDSGSGFRAAPPCTFMLHRSDILAKSHASELKRRFGGLEVLQYLLIDGVFKGAVVGHWRIGPHDVEDIVVELPAADRRSRREEILTEVSKAYRPPRSRILRYAGKGLPGPKR